MKKSYIIASGLALVIAGWMVTGHFSDSAENAAPAAQSDAGENPERISVAVRTLKAEDVMRHIIAQGQVEPNRAVTIRAETAGRVAEIVAAEGLAVAAGGVLVRLELNDRKARLNQAKARVRELRSAYEAAKELGQKGYQAQRRVDEAYSAYQSAQAELEQIQLEIDNTTIRTPFDGILERRAVTLGDYIAINGAVATVVDNDPLVVQVQIAQQDIGRVTLGTVASISFATGQEREGRVRFVAPRAEDATRTFRVEIEVPNPESAIPSGTSAEARIPTGIVSAHFISPAQLTLNDAGRVGVKTVTEDRTVAFHPIAIVLAQADGIWVSGLPDTVQVITVGQGFVQDGEEVRTFEMDRDVGTQRPVAERAVPEVAR